MAGAVTQATRFVVKGQRELEAAFLELRREVLLELTPALVKLAQGVKEDAERLGPQRISNLLSDTAEIDWWQMRIGVVTSGVYLAPARHRTIGPPRRNLGTLLLDEAMQPAVDKNQDKIVVGLDALVDASAAKAGFF